MKAAGVHRTVNYVVNRPAIGEPLLESFTEDKSRSTLKTMPTQVFITDARH